MTSIRRRGETYRPLDLDGSEAPFQMGLQPSTTDPRFAQQMCYALTMTTYEQFRQALGRTPDFSFDAHEGDGDRVKLHVRPHARKEDNAYYDPDEGALFFGYTFANRKTVGANQPGGIVFTSPLARRHHPRDDARAARRDAIAADAADQSRCRRLS